jgi:hypothetical protein
VAVKLNGSLLLQLQFAVGCGFVNIVVCIVFRSDWVTRSEQCLRMMST